MLTNADAQAAVHAKDELALAVRAAAERAKVVHGAGHKTLVDMIPLDDWENWDASDEKALVTDNHDLDEEDFLDPSDERIAA